MMQTEGTAPLSIPSKIPLHINISSTGCNNNEEKLGPSEPNGERSELKSSHNISAPCTSVTPDKTRQKHDNSKPRDSMLIIRDKQPEKGDLGAATSPKGSQLIPKRPLAMKYPRNFDERISALKTKVTSVQAQKKIKNDGKSISTGTSKANYIDPRIVFAWTKRNDVPIRKLFSQTLVTKYYWAADVDPDFRF